MPNSGVNSAGCDTGRDDGFANIKADAFCEILGQEIDRVRNESAQQVEDMRRQYEMELQELRREFNLRQSEEAGITGREAKDNKQSQGEL